MYILGGPTENVNGTLSSYNGPQTWSIQNVIRKSH